jgi:anti-sigma28 factor (negative regulator of flagellin synthesis)
MSTSADQTKRATPNEVTAERIEEILQRIADGSASPTRMPLAPQRP